MSLNYSIWVEMSLRRRLAISLSDRSFSSLRTS